MRICFVTPYGYPMLAGDGDAGVVGGAEVQQLLISTELARRGHEVSLISLDFGQREGEHLRGVFCLKTHTPQAGSGLVGFFHPRITALWAAMRRADADVYYQRSSGINTGFVAAFARRHGRRMVFASAAATDFDPRLPRLNSLRDRWLYRYGLAHAHQIVVQSEQQAAACRTNFRREAVCINSCYGHRGMPARQDGAILWVGNTRAHKRPDLFVALAERLPQFRFRLVGGSSLDDSRFQAIVERARLLPNLELTGFVPYPQVESQFDGASIIVNTSPAEGFPNTFLQAWSRGMPSVGFFDIGARLDGVGVGQHVPSLEAMADAIVRLKADPVLWRNAGRLGEKYVARNNSLQNVVDRYEALFSAILPLAQVVSA